MPCETSFQSRSFTTIYLAMSDSKMWALKLSSAPASRGSWLYFFWVPMPLSSDPTNSSYHTANRDAYFHVCIPRTSMNSLEHRPCLLPRTPSYCAQLLLAVSPQGRRPHECETLAYTQDSPAAEEWVRPTIPASHVFLHLHVSTVPTWWIIWLEIILSQKREKGKLWPVSST